MVTKQEVEAITNAAIAEYFEAMHPLMTENIPRERLGAAHDYAKRKVLKKMRLIKPGEWSFK